MLQERQLCSGALVRLKIPLTFRTDPDMIRPYSKPLIDCMHGSLGEVCLEASGAHHSQRGIPKRPATDRIPAGLLKPFLITAATHDGALLKHPVFHAAPPHCIARHAHLSALALHKPICLAFTMLIACAVNLGDCYRLLKRMLQSQRCIWLSRQSEALES